MYKCMNCETFTSDNEEVAKCDKCMAIFHRSCAWLIEGSEISWSCPNCKLKGDNSDSEDSNDEDMVSSPRAHQVNMSQSEAGLSFTDANASTAGEGVSLLSLGLGNNGTMNMTQSDAESSFTDANAATAGEGIALLSLGLGNNETMNMTQSDAESSFTDANAATAGEGVALLSLGLGNNETMNMSQSDAGSSFTDANAATAGEGVALLSLGLGNNETMNMSQSDAGSSFTDANAATAGEDVALLSLSLGNNETMNMSHSDAGSSFTDANAATAGRGVALLSLGLGNNETMNMCQSDAGSSFTDANAATAGEDVALLSLSLGNNETMNMSHSDAGSSFTDANAATAGEGVALLSLGLGNNETMNISQPDVGPSFTVANATAAGEGVAVLSLGVGNNESMDMSQPDAGPSFTDANAATAGEGVALLSLGLGNNETMNMSQPDAGPSFTDDVAAAAGEGVACKMKEFHNMIAEHRNLVVEINTRIEAIEHKLEGRNLAAEREEMLGLNTRIEDIEQRLEDLECRDAATPPPEEEQEYPNLQRMFGEARMRDEERLQETLLSDFVIAELPERNNENIVQAVTNLATCLGISLEESDIAFAERQGLAPVNEDGTPRRTRRVVVRMMNQSLRDEMLRRARAYPVLTVNDAFGTDASDNSRIYLNERLTHENSRLFRYGRMECRKFQWRYCWTKRGRIFVREDQGLPAHRIRCYEDLLQVFGQLENGYNFHDYNIKLNDVVQLMVRTEPDEENSNAQSKTETDAICEDGNKEEDNSKNTNIYKDAESVLYAIGDLVDVRNQELGAWMEGRIVKIVNDPNAENLANMSDKTDTKDTFNAENATKDESSKPKKGIAKYFSNSPNAVKEQNNMGTDVHLLFKVQFDFDEEDSNIFCKLNDIRPRARTVIDIQDVKVAQKIMINYNVDEPLERGYWYDFKVGRINKSRAVYELTGTLYLGPDAVPQDDTKVRVHDKIFAIEKPVPLAQRSEEYKTMMITPPESRSVPLTCLTCRDNPDELCKDCGCFLCAGKEFPEKIVLCDECNNGYHMICLTPPLTELPEEDWYCPSCKRDPNDVVAPGAAKQTKKSAKTKRDWGRGMACAGKTKTSAMPANHFGPIPGIEVGMSWRFRIQLSESGVHRPPVSGIHGRDVEGAYSIVLSGGYEDDVDNGYEFTYTGSGGRDLSGNKRTAEQSCDQTLTRENRALARNCAVNHVIEEGDDAGDNWRNGRPVRVVRSCKMLKHFPKFAPKDGIRYDGIYKVVKYYPEQGLSGFRVWKYLLRRDDPNPAPWEPGAKEYPIVYPDGYLEAEAEKKALKGKNVKKGKGKGHRKRALRGGNQTTESEGEPSPPIKKRKIDHKTPKTTKKVSKKFLPESPKGKATTLFRKNPVRKVTLDKSPVKNVEKESTEGRGDTKEVMSLLNPEVREAINGDTLNSKMWQECLVVGETRGKKEFVEYTTQMFLCIICQDVVANPVTTPCLHNFCMGCIKVAFRSTNTCPCCRHKLVNYEPETNEQLKTALRSVMPGYDAGKK